MYTIKTQADYQHAYKQSVEQPEKFWDDIASHFYWRKKWSKTLAWDFEKPEVKWFLDGKFNITENCIDRHLEKRKNQVAFIFEPNDINASSQKITYQQLHDEVCRTANMLKRQGVKKGDRVCIYLPMIPQVVYAMLACARIGAVHSVVFAGFSSGSLVDRITDSGAKVVITADSSFRGDKKIELKNIVDDAVAKCPHVESVVVYAHTHSSVAWHERDVWWHEAAQQESTTCSAEEMDAEDLLFILYTSGSTGKPKGMVHTCGGYMVYVGYTFRTVFQYQEEQLFWCTADVGWITGHSYTVYAPLLNGGTFVLYEGTPAYPDAGRYWHIVDKYQVQILYTAPTVIRSLQNSSPEFLKKYSLNSLRVLGTVGEPINEEAWHWYDTHIGKNKCPIVDTWWQTETGGMMISNIAGVTPSVPTMATLPLPGIQPEVMDEHGKIITTTEAEGRLVIAFPWPSMARTIYGNHQRFKETYFSTFAGKYFTGDGCKRNEKGIRITGRVDDIIIVSGHNLGTAEIESAVSEHSAVCETAVVGFPHDVKGQAVYAFVVCYNTPREEEHLKKEIRDIVTRIIGAIAKPDKIQVVRALPKTRSGKIMRRILRKIAEGDTSNLGDTSTLIDPTVVEEIKNGAV